MSVENPAAPVTTFATDKLPKFARKRAEMLLREWGIEGGDVLLLVLSELVTNAVKAARAGYYGDVPKVGHRLTRVADGKTIGIEVWDNAAGEPLLAASGLDDEDGRGLLIVAELCQDWGWSRLKGGWKLVWAVVTVEADADSPALARLPAMNA